MHAESREETAPEAPVEQPTEHEPEHEDPTRDRHCRYCGEGPFTFPELGTHSRTCEERKKALEAKEEIDESLGVVPPGDEAGLFKEDGDPHSVLKDILEAHPDIKPNMVREVMSWAQYQPTGTAIHPQQLAYLLTAMRGVSAQTANLVAQKYALALQQVQAGARHQPPGMFPAAGFGTTVSGAPGFTFGGMPGGQPWGGRQGPYQPGVVPPSGALTGYDIYGQPVYAQPQPRGGGLTVAKVTEIMEDVLKKDRNERTLDTLSKAVTEMPQKIEDAIGKLRTSQPGGVVLKKVRVPIDAEGNPCSPETAVSVRFEDIPMRIDQPGARDDAAIKELREELKGLGEKITDQKFDSLNQKIEDLKTGRPGDASPELTEAKNQLATLTGKVEDLKDSLHEKDLEFLGGKLDEMRQQLGNMAFEGFKSDDMKIISQGLTSIKDALESRKPIESLKELFIETPKIPPSSHQQAEPAQRQGLIEKLRKEGFVTTFRQRMGTQQ